MNYLDMLCESIDRAYERFERLFEGVSIEEANRFPVEDRAPQIKSMTWLAWHTARELDFQIADLASTSPIWHSRFPMRIADDEQDWKHSLERAKQIQTNQVEDLLGYLRAASDSALSYLRGLEPSELDEVIDENWTPPVTRGMRLVSIIDDAAMHSGQVIYARRLLGLKD
ncbi:TPA: DinB family protein [Enterococcus faecium]